MKIVQIILIIITFVFFESCHSTKKNATTTTTPVVTTPNPTVTTSPMLLKPADGVYPPGNEELIAIKAQFKEVTMEKLNEGYQIYNVGACVGCHGKQSIYIPSVEKWKSIIDDMAARASLSEPQKDAVYKYVLSIKAVQVK